MIEPITPYVVAYSPACGIENIWVALNDEILGIII
jgi:hypothetical protein